jgi:hypothetical protein
MPPLTVSADWLSPRATGPALMSAHHPQSLSLVPSLADTVKGLAGRHRLLRVPACMSTTAASHMSLKLPGCLKSLRLRGQDVCLDGVPLRLDQDNPVGSMLLSDWVIVAGTMPLMECWIIKDRFWRLRSRSQVTERLIILFE